MWTYTLLIYNYIIAYFLIYDNEKDTIDFKSPKKKYIKYNISHNVSCIM